MTDEQFYTLKKANWVLRYGSSILLLGLIITIISSLTITYADTAESDCELTTEYQPNELSSLSNNTIQHVFITDNQYIKQGQPLILWKGIEAANEIMKLDSMLQKVAKMEYNISKSMSQLVKYKSINDKLLNIVNTYENQIFTNNNQFEKKSLNPILQQIALLQKSIVEMQSILDVSRKELELAKSQFNDVKQLYSSGAVGKLELEAAKQKEYQKEKETKQLQLNITEKETEKKRLQAQINDVEKQYAVTSNDADIQIQLQTQELKSIIEAWKNEYLVIAPSDGIATFLTNLQSGQFLSAGTKFISIVPTNVSDKQNKIVATAYMNIHQSALVREGQRASIEMNGYPALKFGYLDGVVSKKSLIPKDNFSYLNIELSHHLTTDKGTQIPFEQKMKGRLKVITENRSIADRILGFLTGQQH